MNSSLDTAGMEWAQEIFAKISIKLMAECKRNVHVIPYIPRDGRYHDLDSPDGLFWWTNGFWPGILWQMYNATGDEQYRKTAEEVEKRLDETLEGFEGLHHDVGFMWLHSSVANYRLTGNKDSRRRGLHAANLLAGRYNPAGKFIRAWNGNCKKRIWGNQRAVRMARRGFGTGFRGNSIRAPLKIIKFPSKGSGQPVKGR